MGSPLSPVRADLFMEEFELDTIENADLRPNLWLRYVEVWPHGKTTLQEFLLHLNSQHPLIKFNMEQEKNNTITFLDVQVTRRACCTLAYTVHRKPTHTDRYLHSSSFHHPRFKSAVHNTLVRRAFSTCDQHSLKQELQQIKTSLQLNGYKHFNFNQPKPSLPPEERPQFKSTITLPYIGHTSNLPYVLTINIAVFTSLNAKHLHFNLVIMERESRVQNNYVRLIYLFLS